MSTFEPRLSRYCRMTPERRSAIREYNRALRSGQLVRQPCEVCGATERIHGHHPDYEKPLDVMWLCQEHHLQWHEKHGQGLNNGEPDGVYPRRTRLVGRRFGKLTVVSRVESGRATRGDYLWRCDCCCGASVVRSTNQLRESACPSCVQCRQAYFDWVRTERTQRRAKLIKHGIGLYSNRANDLIEESIRDSIAAELGFFPKQTADRFTGHVTYSGGVSPSVIDRFDSPELFGMRSTVSAAARKGCARGGRRSAALRIGKKKAA